MSKENEWCYYSGMPSPNAYKKTKMSWKQETRMYLAEKLIHWAFIIAPHNYEGLRLKLHIGEYAERMAKKLKQNKDG
jgi:hypothetical protein